jgi:5S rRNA maturation endonuclease (ribonuclease M5)
MYRLGLKESLKFKDISWLMPSVNVRDVLNRLGSEIGRVSGDEIRAFCPDHHLFTGRNPSHANWDVNVKTGKTFCFTEGRGSNLVFVVCNVLDCGTRDAVAFLTNAQGELDIGSLSISAIRQRMSSILATSEVEKPAVKGLNAIADEMVNRYMSEAAYRFFVHPPGKMYPTNILPETVDRYQVFERTWGFYANRVVIPFVLKGFVVGFCALDIIGRDEWVRTHPTKTEDDYKKVRYPMHFVSGDFLFGYDDCVKGEDFVVLVEGPREVMKLWQEGFTNAVAILGSHLSDNQLVLLGELNPGKVMLMFDGDDAGIATTERIADKLDRNFVVEKCFVPRGKDPKNLGLEDFKKLLVA